jgi:hypothetical protein
MLIIATTLKMKTAVIVRTNDYETGCDPDRSCDVYPVQIGKFVLDRLTMNISWPKLPSRFDRPFHDCAPLQSKEKNAAQTTCKRKIEVQHCYTLMYNMKNFSFATTESVYPTGKELMLISNNGVWWKIKLEIFMTDQPILNYTLQLCLGVNTMPTIYYNLFKLTKQKMQVLVKKIKIEIYMAYESSTLHELCLGVNATSNYSFLKLRIQNPRAVIIIKLEISMAYKFFTTPIKQELYQGVNAMSTTYYNILICIVRARIYNPRIIIQILRIIADIAKSQNPNVASKKRPLNSTYYANLFIFYLPNNG